MKSSDIKKSISYKENTLSYENYCYLRKSAKWIELPKEKAKTALEKSIYTISVFVNNEVIGMGRLIGDGIYYTIVDVIVHPNWQQKGIGKNIINKIIKFVNKSTTIGSRSSIQLICEKGKEGFYEKLGFKRIPHDFCGSGMRMIINKQ